MAGRISSARLRKFLLLLALLALWLILFSIFLHYPVTKRFIRQEIPTYVIVEGEVQNEARVQAALRGSLLTRLKIGPDTMSSGKKSTVDYLLNLRKLVLFAVRELNEKITQVAPCGKSKSCPKWWANPLKVEDLNTTITSGGYFVQDLIFIADPGRVPFFAKIQQIMDLSLVNGSDFIELQILGEFTRLGGGGSAHVYDPPPEMPENLNSYNLQENALDPELFSWKRHVSFLVPDYVNFSAPKEELYKISPGERDKSMVPEIYCGSALKMLVMVSSAPPHFENRKVIRETYGSDENLLGKQVRLVFLFGKTQNETLQSLLEQEAAEHDDLIQADFLDSYHNLSLSHLLMYNWVQRTCGEVGLPKYVLKADDDFFLNIDLSLKIAYANPEFELIGTLYCGTKPIRHVAYMTKYYTPRYMYMADEYVGYLSGVSYILRTDIIPRILRISLTTPMIHMDDVYITGLLSRQIGITPKVSALFTYARTPPDACESKKMAASSAESVEDIRVQYNEWVKPLPTNCSLQQVEENLKVGPLSAYDMKMCIFE